MKHIALQHKTMSKDIGLTGAQERTLDDLTRGIILYMDKGGKLRHGPPSMDSYAVKVFSDHDLRTIDLAQHKV